MRRRRSPRGVAKAQATLRSSPTGSSGRGGRDRRATSWVVVVIAAVAAVVAGGAAVGWGSDSGVGVDVASTVAAWGVPSDREATVAALLEQGVSVLRLHREWKLTAFQSMQDARKYLLQHPRMSKHLSAFLQAALGAVEAPQEELGYTYLTCAAGGPVAFDWFAGAINASQSVNRDISRLTRRYAYSSTLHSVLDQRVVDRCGRAIDMQPPAPKLLLPYSDTVQLTLEVAETWTSSRQRGSGARGSSAGKTVSILPFDQWQMSSVTFVAKLTAARSFSHWQELSSQDELEAVLGAQRMATLLQQRTEGEQLVGEARAVCDMTSAVAAAQCLRATTMLASTPPQVTTDIFLEWVDIDWLADTALEQEEDARASNAPAATPPPSAAEHAQVESATILPPTTGSPVVVESVVAKGA